MVAARMQGSLVVLYVEVRVLWYTATGGSECVIITNLYEM